MRAWLREKAKRYVPGEILATITALGSAWIAKMLGGNMGVIAFAGTWGENIGFYGFHIFREVRECLKSNPNQSKLALISKTFRNLVLEFGTSEIFDSWLIRPGAMYLGQKLLGNYALGVLAGKIIADLIFYVLAAKMHDVRKSCIKD